MNSATLLKEDLWDSAIEIDNLFAPTNSSLENISLSKEQVMSKISNFSPESSNQGKVQIFQEDLVTEEKTPVESGSSSIYFLKRNIKKSVAFNSLFKREGIVLSISEKHFTAKLVDLEHKAPNEIADFPFDEISDDDKSLLKEGSVFYWNIGFKLLPTGQKERSSLIRFRRLPAWSRREIESAHKKAEELASLFGW